MKAVIAKILASIGLKLTGVLGWLLSFLIDYIVLKIVDAIRKYQERKELERRIREEVRRKVENLKKAETAEEIDKAADDVLDSL